MRNPFLAGSPVVEPHFADRETETHFLTEAMTRGQNVLLLSPRRYGKTSLLLHATAEVRTTHRARVGVANLLLCRDTADLANEITRAVVDGALGWLVGTAEQIRDLMGRLPGVSATLGHAGWTVRVEGAHGRDEFLAAIRRPIELLADSARDAVPVALVVDEFQQIAAIDSALGGVFKAMTDELPTVAFVFSGSRHHLMSELFVGPGAPLKGVTDTLALSVVPQPEMIAFLRSRATDSRASMSEGAAAFAYALARGVPHYVQLIAAAAFDNPSAGDGPLALDEQAVRRGVVDLLVRGHGELAVRLADMPAADQKILRALAEEPAREITSQAFARRAGLPTATAHQAVRRLEEREHVLFDERLGYRMADPIFERWILHASALERGEAPEIDSITWPNV